MITHTQYRRPLCSLCPLWFMLFSALLALTACRVPADPIPEGMPGAAAEEDQPAAEDTATVTPGEQSGGESGPGRLQPPALTLVLPDGSELTGVQGSFCWSAPPDSQGGAETLCADYVWPPEVQTLGVLRIGESLRFRFAETPADTLSVRVYRLLDGGEPERESSSLFEGSPDDAIAWPPDFPPGDYLILVFATWRSPNRDSSVAFALTAHE